MKKTIIIVVVMVIAFCLYLLLRRHDELPKQSEDPVEAYHNLIREGVAGSDIAIQIFAKVVDGDTNKPLQGVVIDVHYTHFSPIPPMFSRSSTIGSNTTEYNMKGSNTTQSYYSLRRITPLV